LRSFGGDKYLGYIISLFALSSMIVRPISGKLSDNIGRKPIMMLGTGIGVLVLGLYPMLPFVAGFLALRFAHGLSAGFMPTAAATSVSDMVPENQMAKYMGLVGMFASTGMAMGPVIGSSIARTLGIDMLFYGSASITFISLVMLFGVEESLPNTKTLSTTMFTLSRKDLFDRKVSLPSLIMVLTIIGFGVILTLIPDLSDSLGIQNRGTFFFIFTVASVSIRLVLSNTFDKLDRIKVLKIGSLILMISLFLLALATDKYQFYFLAFTIGIGGGINSPILFSWTIHLADSNNKSRALSTLFISLEFGIMAGAWIAGNIFELQLQNYSAPLFIASGCAAVAWAILVFSPLKK